MRKNLLLLLASILFASCNEKVYLTKRILKELTDDGIEVTKIQIYTGNSFEFEKNNSSSDIGVKSGTVLLKKDSSKDIVRFKKDLPCKIESVNDLQTYIKVVFEQNTEPIECRLSNKTITRNEQENQNLMNNSYYEVPYLFTYKGELVKRNVSNNFVTFYFYKNEVNNFRKKVTNVKGVRVK